ncbi:MAG: V-type ATP synthase subunit I [Candidatus Thermoplasmatota archaeon]|nr:V-type ATP synthase subunit I [Candidatus Thermoplasmatota archaeon]
MSWFPSRMLKADIIVPTVHRDAVISAIYREGIVELKDLRRQGEGYKELVERPEANPKLEELDKIGARLSSMLQIMAKTNKPWVGGIGSLFTIKPDNRVKVREKGLEELLREAARTLEILEKPLFSADKKLEELNHKIEVLSARKRALELVDKMGVGLVFIKKSYFTFTVVGTTPDPEKLREAISPYSAIMESAEVEKGQHVALITGLRKEEGELMAQIKSAGFFALDIGEGGRRADRELGKNVGMLESLEKQRGEILGSIEDLKKKHSWKVLAISEQLQIESSKASSVQKMGKTQSTHLMSTWCPEKDGKRLEGLVKKASNGTGAVYFQEPDGEDPPSKTGNPRWAGPFVPLTEMFGTPGYFEVDPTKIIAPIFIIFFGLMLGDALYGLIITITAVFLYRGSPKYGDGMRAFTIVLIFAGLSTIFFGIIQGGYFGPLISDQPNLAQLMGFNPPTLLDAMQDPITLLVISLIIGLTYINLGLFLAAAERAKRGDLKAIAVQQLPWWLLQPAAFILLGGGLFAWWTFSPEQEMAAWLMTIGGMVLLFIDKKGLFFFDITGFIGSFLSFARLLALGLATAGIALTINVIVGLVAGVSLEVGEASYVLLAAGAGLLAFGAYKRNAILGLVGFVVLAFGATAVLNMTHLFFLGLASFMFIVAHLINCGLQALGSFVHSLRLQYVEFFGFFFEGTGRAFKPFAPERKHTILMEERK